MLINVGHTKSRLLQILALLTMSLVLFNGIFVALAENTTPVTKGKRSVSTWILIPAVITGLPHEEGKLINVTITISFPGNGTISVYSEGGEISGSTRYSMATAIATASLLEGVDWTSFDVNVFIESRGSISGPSGSLAVAIATYVLLNPLLSSNELHKYVITGAIAPEGLAGSVGGVSTKCKVAERAGYTFMLPMSNIRSLKGTNCSNYISVTDVLDAVRRIYSLSTDMIGVTLNMRYPKELADVMRAFTVNVTKLVNENINLTERILVQVPADKVASIKSYLKYSMNFINRSLEILKKYPYSAASLAYTAYVYSLLAKYTAMSYTFNNFKDFINERISNVDMSLNALRSRLVRIKPSTLERLEIISVAAARLADAYFALSTARSLATTQTNSSLTLYQLALAESRSLSIKSWILVAERLKGMISISDLQIKSLALKAYNFAKLNIGYAIALLKSSNLKAEVNALEDLDKRMNDAFNKKDWTLLIGYAREALSKATDYVFEYSIMALPSSEIKEIGPIYARNIEFIAEALSSFLSFHGIASPLAPVYIEYYKVLMSEKSYDVALKLLWSAVSDLEVLSLLFLSSPSYLLNLSPFSALPPTTSTSISINRLTATIMIISSAIIAFSIGYLLATRNTLKEIEARLAT